MATTNTRGVEVVNGPTIISFFVVEFRCMACGREHETTVGALVELPDLAERCARCGGSVLAVGYTPRVIRTDNPFNSSEGAPRRGRPPKSRTATVVHLDEELEH